MTNSTLTRTSTRPVTPLQTTPQVALPSAPESESLHYRRATREQAASMFARLTGRGMKWICEESGDIIKMSILEPMNKPVYCNGCGKKHLLKPGEMSDEDKDVLKRVREAAREDADVYIMCDSITDRLSQKSVSFMADVDRYDQREQRVSTGLGGRNR